MKLFLWITAVLCVYAAPALAQVVDTVSTSVDIPIGAIISEGVSYLGVALLAGIAWGLRKLPAPIYGLLMTIRAEQLFGRALAFGANSIRDASRDNVLTVNVGNKVLAETLSYMLIHGASAVKGFIGTPLETAEMIWARLNLPPEAERPDFRLVVANVVATLPAKK